MTNEDLSFDLVTNRSLCHIFHQFLTEDLPVFILFTPNQLKACHVYPDPHHYANACRDGAFHPRRGGRGWSHLHPHRTASLTEVEGGSPPLFFWQKILCGMMKRIWIHVARFYWSDINMMMSIPIFY